MNAKRHKQHNSPDKGAVLSLLVTVYCSLNAKREEKWKSL